MDVTKVMAYFSMIGDQFPLDRVTRDLAIEPTETFVKGEIIENRGPATVKARRRLETDWTLSTGYQKSFDINDQLQPLLALLEGKEKDLIRLKNEYNISYLFSIVIEVENNETPAMYLEKEFIDFASAIGAEIAFDLYIMEREDPNDSF